MGNAIFRLPEVNYHALSKDNSGRNFLGRLSTVLKSLEKDKQSIVVSENHFSS